MRISDWSSDVCSSDLGVQPVGDLPIVLREDRPGRALERRRGVVDVAGGGEIALGTDRLTQGELLRRRVGFPPIRQQAFAQRVDVLEIERRSEEHTSELQSLMRISYAVFCLKKKTHTTTVSNYN